MFSLPSSLVPKKSLSARDLQTQIEQGLSDRFTGLMHVTFHSGITTTLFVHQGKVRQLYIRNHRVPDLHWKYPLSLYGDGILEIEPLPARALHFKKIILEELKPVKPKPTTTSQLSAVFDLAEHNPGPTLFHIQWETAEGFVLVAGKSILLRHAILLHQTAAEEGTVALNQISAWNEAQCNLTVYHGDIKNQAWLEVHLNIFFEWYCNRILNYYEHLTGNVILQSILRRIYMLAIDEGWNIETKRKSLSDTSIFASAATAAEAYKKILLLMEKQIEPVIGSALTQKILNLAYDDIPRDVYKTIVEAFELMGSVSI